MVTRKTAPQLPFPDRRQGRRYLTKKTVLGTIGIAAVIFLAITIRSEMRHPNGQDYGRLYEKQVQKLKPVEPQAIPVVTEAPVAEGASADPFSLDAAQREQYLGDTRLTPPPTTASALGFGGEQQSSLRVEGGPDGVTVTNTEPRPKPVLGGGFGRP